MTVLDSQKGGHVRYWHCLVPPFVWRYQTCLLAPLPWTWCLWALDAVDFLFITFVLADIARSFDVTLHTASLLILAIFGVRWLGGLLFGNLSDKIGRKEPTLMFLLLPRIFRRQSFLGVLALGKGPWAWRRSFFRTRLRRLRSDRQTSLRRERQFLPCTLGNRVMGSARLEPSSTWSRRTRVRKRPLEALVHGNALPSSYTRDAC